MSLFFFFSKPPFCSFYNLRGCLHNCWWNDMSLIFTNSQEGKTGLVWFLQSTIQLGNLLFFLMGKLVSSRQSKFDKMSFALQQEGKTLRYFNGNKRTHFCSLRPTSDFLQFSKDTHFIHSCIYICTYQWRLLILVY